MQKKSYDLPMNPMKRVIVLTNQKSLTFCIYSSNGDDVIVHRHPHTLAITKPP